VFEVLSVKPKCLNKNYVATMNRLSSQISHLVPPTGQHPTCGLGRRPTGNRGPLVMDLQRVLAAAYAIQEYKDSILSGQGNARQEGSVIATNRPVDLVGDSGPRLDPKDGLGRRPTSNSGPMVMDLQRVLAAAYVVQEYKKEVPSVKPDAFKKGPVAVTNRLGGQVLSGESETRPEPKCARYRPAMANVSSPVIDFHKISAAAYVGHDYKNDLAAVDTEFLESGRRCAWSSDPAYKKMTRLWHEFWREYPAGVRSFRTWLATALVLMGVVGYGYHLNRLARVSTSMPAARVAETRWKSPILDEQRALFNLDKKTKGQPKALTHAVTTDVQEAVLVINGTVQGRDNTPGRAQAGDIIAQYEMAERYADGAGVPQNYRAAMEWFAKAAASGSPSAQWKLGLGYLGGIGMPRDERKAAGWFKRAANRGHIGAQTALSELYLNGRGVQRDYVRAYTWACIAAGLRPNENDRLKVIGSRMTAVEIEEAHRKVSTWREQDQRASASAIRGKPRRAF
jgi:Sel1 repeat-containing protein